jgi:hypothetical protein
VWRGSLEFRVLFVWSLRGMWWGRKRGKKREREEAG